MTREMARKNLELLGCTDVTEEQITNYLNQIGGETKREKERAEKYKEDAEKMVELQKQLDDLSNQNLSDIEKASKENEKANLQIAELQKQIKAMETRTSLAELGIVGEQAEKLINADGQMDFAVLGQIISERETKASSQKEQEILKQTPNPEGGNNGGADEKTEADKFAERMGNRIAEANKTADDVVAQYTN